MAKTLIGLNVNMIEMLAADGSSKAYFETMPNNLVDESGVLSPKVFVNYLKEFKKNSKISTKDCAVVMPEGTTYYRTINSPVLTDEQIKLNLPFEFKNYVGNDTNNYNYDYYVNGVEYNEQNQPTGIKLVAAAGLKETVNQYADLFKEAGLNLKVALPKEVCLINLMKKVAKEDQEYCLVELGYNSTNIYIFKGAELVSTKVIDLATRQIDIAIGGELGTDEYLAAGYRESNHEECLHCDSVKDIYERIALEVMKTINFYKYENTDSELNTAYFFDMSSGNNKLTKTICDQINFTKGDINELLPSGYKNNDKAARCLLSIGLVL